MAEVKLRYNPEAEEVELVVDGEVAISSGTEEFVSWVDYYQEAHQPEPDPEPTAEEKAEAERAAFRAEVDAAQVEIEQLKRELEESKAAKQEPETPVAPEVDSAE